MQTAVHCAAPAVTVTAHTCQLRTDHSALHYTSAPEADVQKEAALEAEVSLVPYRTKLEHAAVSVADEESAPTKPVQPEKQVAEYAEQAKDKAADVEVEAKDATDAAHVQSEPETGDVSVQAGVEPVEAVEDGPAQDYVKDTDVVDMPAAVVDETKTDAAANPETDAAVDAPEPETRTDDAQPDTALGESPIAAQAGDHTRTREALVEDEEKAESPDTPASAADTVEVNDKPAPLPAAERAPAAVNQLVAYEVGEEDVAVDAEPVQAKAKDDPEGAVDDGAAVDADGDGDLEKTEPVAPVAEASRDIAPLEAGPCAALAAAPTPEVEEGQKAEEEGVAAKPEALCEVKAVVPTAEAQVTKDDEPEEVFVEAKAAGPQTPGEADVPEAQAGVEFKAEEAQAAVEEEAADEEIEAEVKAAEPGAALGADVQADELVAGVEAKVTVAEVKAAESIGMTEDDAVEAAVDGAGMRKTCCARRNIDVPFSQRTNTHASGSCGES